MKTGGKSRSIDTPLYTISNNLIALSRAYRKEVQRLLQKKLGRKKAYTTLEYAWANIQLRLEQRISEELISQTEGYFDQALMGDLARTLRHMVFSSEVMKDFKQKLIEERIVHD